VVGDAVAGQGEEDDLGALEAENAGGFGKNQLSSR